MAGATRSSAGGNSATPATVGDASRSMPVMAATRSSLLELVRWTAVLWPFEVVAMLLPTGMLSVFTGAVDDGYGGTLGWTWAMCAVTTIGLCFVTRAALRERQYSAVMAATGLLYLAILTAFGTDLIARAVLA